MNFFSLLIVSFGLIFATSSRAGSDYILEITNNTDLEIEFRNIRTDCFEYIRSDRLHAMSNLRVWLVPSSSGSCRDRAAFATFDLTAVGKQVTKWSDLCVQIPSDGKMSGGMKVDNCGKYDPSFTIHSTGNAAIVKISKARLANAMAGAPEANTPQNTAQALQAPPAQPKTLAEKLMLLVYFPQFFGNSKIPDPLALPNLLEELRFATAHLPNHMRVNSNHFHPDDVGCSVRDEAASLAGWLKANPKMVAEFEQNLHPKFVSMLDQALETIAPKGPPGPDIGPSGSMGR